MFDHETVGIGGEPEPMQIVLGLVDDYGRVIGWFGKDYHPNLDLVDEVGALEPPLAKRPRIVIGVADEDEIYLVGGLGGFLKKIGRAVASPITAPISAVKAIAQGKNVLKSVTRSVTAPVRSGLSLAKAVTKPVIRTAGAISKPVFGTKFSRTFQKAAMAPLTSAELLARGKVSKAFTQPIRTGLAFTGAAAAMPIKTASSIARPFVGKTAARALTNVSLTPISAAQRLAAGNVRAAGSLMLQSGAQGIRGLSPILKSPLTKSIATGVALAFPPVGVPLAAGLMAANVALPYAQGALAAADKVLAAAKGTLPAQRQAPADVAWALQQAAKFTVAKTYQAANLGSQDAQRAVQVLVQARRVQQTIPAAQAALHPTASVSEGSVHEAPIYSQGQVMRGVWQKNAQSPTHSGPMVLSNGVIVRGGWRPAPAAG
jgi:hypothetical protein